MMLDLETLGRELRERRKGLRIRSAELARRIGVSQTYVWLIESAKPRAGGEPSRPGEDVLARWTAALGMDAEETRRIRALAGYFDPEVRPPPGARYARMPAPAPIVEQPHIESARPSGEFRVQAAAMPAPPFVPQADALRQWAGASGVEEPEPDVTARTEHVLASAEASGRGEEAQNLLRSFLDWLEFHLKNR
jgi:transcriptional regulator with XRE-family HTH domain